LNPFFAPKSAQNRAKHVPQQQYHCFYHKNQVDEDEADFLFLVIGCTKR